MAALLLGSVSPLIFSTAHFSHSEVSLKLRNYVQVPGEQKLERRLTKLLGSQQNILHLVGAKVEV